MAEKRCINITIPHDTVRYLNITDVTAMEAIANCPQFHMLLGNLLKTFYDFLVDSSTSRFIPVPVLNTPRSNGRGDSVCSNSDVGRSSESLNRLSVTQTIRTNYAPRIAQEDTKSRSRFVRLGSQTHDDANDEVDNETSFRAAKRPNNPRGDKTQACDKASDDVFKVPRPPPPKRRSVSQNSVCSDPSANRSRSGRVYKSVNTSWFNCCTGSSKDKATSIRSTNSDWSHRERTAPDPFVRLDRLPNLCSYLELSNRNTGTTKRGISKTERKTKKPTGDGTKSAASGDPRRGRPSSIASHASVSSSNVSYDSKGRTRLSRRAMSSSIHDESGASFCPPLKTSAKILKSAPVRKKPDQTARAESAQDETRTFTKTAENSEKTDRARSEDLSDEVSSDEECSANLNESSHMAQLRRNFLILESLKNQSVFKKKDTGKRALPSKQTNMTAGSDSDKESESNFQRVSLKKAEDGLQNKTIREKGSGRQPEINTRVKRIGPSNKDAACDRRSTLSDSCSKDGSVGGIRRGRQRTSVVKHSSEDSDESFSDELLRRCIKRPQLQSSAVQKGLKRSHLFSVIDSD